MRVWSGHMHTFLPAIALGAFTLVTGIHATAAVTGPVLNLIPWPAQVTRGEGAFTWNEQTPVIVSGSFATEATRLAAAMGLPTAPTGTGIVLRQANDLPAEGYLLEVTPRGVTVTAATPAGAFYGCQTLRQLMTGKTLPCLRIQDAPRMAWRGFMLDVSRHFFDKTEVKAVLDQMAALKLNVFHWHLTDDNGWRIEIKKYPKLTTVGAWHPVTAQDKRSPHIVDGRYGGFYTQDDIREVVAYAAALHIRVLPEIDMPGHMSAVATAYPEFSPANGWTPMLMRQEQSSGERCAALCVGRPQVVEFCKDVLAEVLPLFPSKEIHIGGDEVFYDQWAPCPDMQALKQKLNAKDWEEVQVAFGNEIAAYLADRGRTAIFWNNIYRQSVDKRAIHHFWRTPMNHARDFANAGYQVLISDASFYYFDHHPPLERAYLNDPLAIAGLKPDAQSRVIGMESCAWTEHVVTFQDLLRDIYPNVIAHAESAWTPQDQKDWTAFQARLASFPVPGAKTTP